MTDQISCCLVTGASGFVGRALCAALGLQGHLVRSATRTTPDRPQTLSFAIGNIGPDTDWGAAVAGCDAVVHLAAHVHVMRRQAGDAGREFHRVNVEGSENLARQAARAGVRSDFSTYHGQRNLVCVYVKNMPAMLFWPLLPYHLILNAAALLGCTLRGQGRIALKAKVDAVRGIVGVWRKRSATQRLRRTSVARIWALLAGGWPWPRC